MQISKRVSKRDVNVRIHVLSECCSKCECIETLALEVYQLTQTGHVSSRVPGGVLKLSRL